MQVIKESDMSSTNRNTPRKRIMQYMHAQGIKINDSYVKTQRPLGQRIPLYCPFANCMREFQETGNLKTHIRIHVSIKRGL